MKKGRRVRVIDAKRSQFLQEGVLAMRCLECKHDGYDAWYVRFEEGRLGHFLTDQLKEVAPCPR